MSTILKLLLIGILAGIGSQLVPSFFGELTGYISIIYPYCFIAMCTGLVLLKLNTIFERKESEKGDSRGKTQTDIHD